MLPQWLFGLTFIYPAYFCKRAKNNNKKYNNNPKPAFKKKYSQGEWKRRDIFEPCDTEVGRTLGLVPIEQHVKDAEAMVLPAVLNVERKAIHPRQTLMTIALENEVDVEKEVNMYGR